ncbi:MAG: dienelactone hydrolase family protein [Caldilineaceae bacterium]|nr:dienelactone hydrolase family protein [Caldilineaceae bacterium]
MADRVDFTTLTTLWQEYEGMPRQLACRATTTEQWDAWRERLHAKLVELLGGFPATKAPLQPVLLETRELPEYRLEKVALQSEPGIYIPCYVLIPHQVAPPYRPVIALHGHGSGGAAHLLGLTRNQATRAEELAHIEAHNYDYAHQLARRGFMVFVPEQRGFGERMEDHAGLVNGSEMWQSSCRALAFNAMLMGKTVLGMRVWDVMRTLDYIASRPEATTGTVGCVGLSGGGTTTLYAAALDPRITAAVISGAFSSFRTSIMSTIHCECNYVPNILQYAEMADIAALIAPRAQLVESALQDPIFPVDEAKAACQEVARVYALLGVPERFDQDIFEGGHRFGGNKAFDWFARWL